MSELLTNLGHNLDEESFKETPRRFVKFMMDFTPYKVEPKFTTFPTTNKNVIIIEDLEVRSMCAHHLAPFFGKCSIVYRPSGRMAGLSKFQRVLDYLCKTPTEQETLTDKIRDYLVDKLQSDEVMVVMNAQHTCMIVRGVCVSNSNTRTIAGPSNEYSYNELFKYLK